MTAALLSYAIYAGDVFVILIPGEFLAAAREAFPESIGYRFIKK
ncbi:MAG TPA: hypothetical protein VN794_18610 [Methylomirabilota bacterium]|nr:hypothetical protein [Methylomirabilota bacterium]